MIQKNIKNKNARTFFIVLFVMALIGISVFITLWLTERNKSKEKTVINPNPPKGEALLIRTEQVQSNEEIFARIENNRYINN